MGGVAATAATAASLQHLDRDGDDDGPITRRDFLRRFRTRFPIIDWARLPGVGTLATGRVPVVRAATATIGTEGNEGWGRSLSWFSSFASIQEFSPHPRQSAASAVLSFRPNLMTALLGWGQQWQASKELRATKNTRRLKGK
ncbi:MAG: hypothetical protein WD872_00305 [Pirellulaceae bacterium]